METFKRSPLQLFNQPQHFLIPLFQRRYVWTEDDQWAPLWKDVRRVAELRLDQPHLNSQHFMGAVVLQAQEARSSNVLTWSIIDGQQRLTTLQILMDATAAVLEPVDHSKLARRLQRLTHNSADYIADGESLLKLRHLNIDRAAFDEVMSAPAPVAHQILANRDHKIVQTHLFFTNAVAEWLGDPDDEHFGEKADALATVLEAGLQLVTIELLASEDSQEIFETLNARGTPLTAADLVRNYVFQRLEAEGSDTSQAYEKHWPFETPFWSKEVSVGRLLISRSSLFLNQWLSARMGEEISPQATFSRFKAYVEHHAEQTMTTLLLVIKEQADLYEEWTLAAARPGGDLSATEMAVYRMNAGRIELLKPVLIWLHEPGRDLPGSVVDQVIRAFESWIYRRQLLRLTSSDLGRIVADVVRAHDQAPAGELAERVTAHLARQNAASTYWPGDAEVRSELATAKVYNQFSRPRLRVFLEAIENRYRAETRQPQVERADYPIEHILPRKWREHWPVAEPAQEDDRQDRVNRLGNLTLLTTSLNSKVSNSPWQTKRRALLEHNTLKLTGRLLERASDQWDETEIDRRTTVMVDALLEVWPVPDGHTGKVIEPITGGAGWVEVRHLVDADLLQVGDLLHGRNAEAQAVIGADKRLQVDGQSFTTPSGAAKHARGSQINGWWWWSLTDGRRLMDVRAELIANRME